MADQKSAPIHLTLTNITKDEIAQNRRILKSILEAVLYLATGPAEAVRPRRPWSDQKFFQCGQSLIYFQNFGRTNNCVVVAFLKWSDQSRTPSAAPEQGKTLHSEVTEMIQSMLS